VKDIVLGHKAERDEFLRAQYVQREGLQNARKNMKNNLIKVIVGPRRAGKSVFAIQMLEGLDFAYLNFDDERLLDISDYDDLLKAIKQASPQGAQSRNYRLKLTPPEQGTCHPLDRPLYPVPDISIFFF